MRLWQLMAVILISGLMLGYVMWLLQQPPAILALSVRVLSETGTLVGIALLVAFFTTWWEECRHQDP